MKICISSTGKDLSSPVDPRFGRCAYFLIVDPAKEEKFEVVKNAGVRAERGAGITAAQVIADKKVNAAISGNFGPNAYFVLSQAGIKCYFVPRPMSVKQALQFLKQGKLKKLTESPTPTRFGGGPGSWRDKR